MKRNAENYITKDTASDDEIEETTAEGFRKADDAVLATRKIRALPKRSAAGTPPATATTNGASTPEPSSAPTPKFTGFAGFGSPSNSFSFTPPVSASSSFASTPFQPSSGSSSSLLPSTSAVTQTASNTAKTFASFLSEPTKPSATAEAPDVEDPAALKYYTSLRGLNLSLISALSKTIEEDPFNDVADILEKYKTMRLDVQSEFDKKSKSPPISSSFKPPISMPVPPSTFSGFSAPSPQTLGKTGGFTPKLDTSQSSTSISSSGFSFPTTTLSSTPTPGSASSTSQPTAQMNTNPFTMTSSATSNSTSNSSNTNNKSSSLGSFVFGSSSSTPSSGTDKPNTTSFGATVSSANLFGNNKLDTSGGTSSSSSPPKTTFGGFGGFGKPSSGAGSIGNPVGFGFGILPKTHNSNGGSISGSGSVNKGTSGDDENDKTHESEEMGSSEGSTPNVGLLGNNPHDEEGEGEEQEDTVYSAKLKAFRLKKVDEKGGSGWIELGYGVLRLKKHKETEVRRILLRNSSTGKININFNIYPGLKPAQTKKNVTVVGHDNGVSQTYNLQLQSIEQAISLKEALDKEVALMKSKSEN